MTENERDVKLTVPKGMDAREWAQSLMAHSKRYGFEIDEETMLGWFANAIMSGYDEGRRRLRAESLERAAALEAQDEADLRSRLAAAEKQIDADCAGIMRLQAELRKANAALSQAEAANAKLRGSLALIASWEEGAGNSAREARAALRGEK